MRQQQQQDEEAAAPSETIPRRFDRSNDLGSVATTSSPQRYHCFHCRHHHRFASVPPLPREMIKLAAAKAAPWHGASMVTMDGGWWFDPTAAIVSSPEGHRTHGKFSIVIVPEYSSTSTLLFVTAKFRSFLEKDTERSLGLALIFMLLWNSHTNLSGQCQHVTP